MTIAKSKLEWNAKAKGKLLVRVLTIGHTGDAELVRHTYATNGSVAELSKLVSNYLDDCECDYDDAEVDDAVDDLREEEFARIGDHFFRLTDLENA